MTYDPTIQGHLANIFDRWGNPLENREGLVPYGIPLLDKEFWGLAVDRGGEMILLIGEEKNRKTTLAINIVVNYMTNGNLTKKPNTVIDTLESGMQPERYVDQIICNLASRLLIDMGHVPIVKQHCPVCGQQCKELRLSPEFLHYMNRSGQQKKAIEFAIENMKTWPLSIYGASLEQGNTRSLQQAINMDTLQGRWNRLVEDDGVQIFFADHLQQYRYETDTTDYEKMVRSVSVHGDFVAAYGPTHGVVSIDLSQVSLNSLKEVKSGGKMKAMGGSKGHQESSKIISTKYQENSGVLKIVIEGSRTSGTGYAEYFIDDVSGALYGLT